MLSDDLRLLRRVARTGRADAGPLEAVALLGRLFGTRPELGPAVMSRNETPEPVES